MFQALLSSKKVFAKIKLKGKGCIMLKIKYFYYDFQ